MNKQKFFDVLASEFNAKTLWQTSVKDQPFILTAYSISGRVLIVQEFTKSEGCLFYFPESFCNPTARNTWQETLEFIKANIELINA